MSEIASLIFLSTILLNRAFLGLILHLPVGLELTSQLIFILFAGGFLILGDKIFPGGALTVFGDVRTPGGIGVVCG